MITIKPTRCTNFSYLFLEENYMFQTVYLSIIRRFLPYTQQWYMSYRFPDSLWAGSGWSSILILLKNSQWWTEELSKTRRPSVLILLASCQQTCVTYTTTVSTVKNCWWWTEELSETCRVLFQK